MFTNKTNERDQWKRAGHQAGPDPGPEGRDTGGGGRSASTVYKNWTKLRHCKSEAAEVNRKCCHMVGW